MEKLKNMISPGHADDDQKLYDTEGSSNHPSSTAAAQGSVPSQSSHLPGQGSGTTGIATAPGATGGSTQMPGSFDNPREQGARHLGAQSAATSAAQQSSTHPSTATSGIGGSTGTASTSQYDSRVPPTSGQQLGSSGAPLGSSTAGSYPAGSAPSGTGHTSGLFGSTTHPSTTTTSTSGVPSSGLGHSSTSGTSAPLGGSTTSRVDPSSTSTTGTTSGGTTGRLQDPAFSNRTLHQSHHPEPSATSGHHGREALAGTGAGAAGYEAAQHTGHHGQHGTSTHPTSGLTGFHPASGLTGSQPTSGISGATSTLPDRSAPHADIGQTTTERSFPLGGHAGEGPHAITTANRLDPRVPDTAQEYRQGTHHHGGDSTTAGIGSTSAVPGTSTTSGVPHGTGSGLSSGTTSSRDHHLGRDAALGAGGAGLGAAGAHELGRGHGTRDTDPSGSGARGTGPTMTSRTGPTGTSHNAPPMTSGTGQPTGGQQYNTLSDGTPSGISTRDAAHPLPSSTGPTTSSTTGSHQPSHVGRDVGLGAGALGATGLAAHEASQRSHPSGNTTTSGGVGEPAGSKYNSLGSGTPSGISSHDPAHSSTLPTSHSTSTTGPTSHGGSHLGRDAALGTGAAGLGSGAAYEASGHGASTRSSHIPGQQTTSTSGQPSHGGSHLGRDGAVGAGAAGLGSGTAYEATRHSGNQHPSTGQPLGATGGHGLPSEYKSEGLPTSGSSHPSSHVPGTTSARDPTSTTGSSGHHYGRDAGIGSAGVGATGLAAHEYGQHHHPSSGTSGVPSQLTTGSAPQHAPVPGYNQPTAAPGQTSATHPTGAAAQKAQDSMSNYPEQSASHGSHKGRDAAAVGGVGGAGSAYEAEKYRHDKGHRDAKHDHQDTEEKKPGLVDKLLGRDPEKKQQKEHEKEQAMIEKEHKKEEKQHEKELKREEKEEKKHEKELKKEGTHHKEEGAAAGALGAGGLTAEEHHRHGAHGHEKDRGSVPGTGTHGQEPFASPSTGSRYDTADGRVPTTGPTGAGGNFAPRSNTTHDNSHLGRDTAAVGAGAVGAGYAGDKLAHSGSGTHTGAPSSGMTGQNYAQQPMSGTTAPMQGYGTSHPTTSGATTQGGSHLGRDAGLASAGGAGLGATGGDMAHSSQTGPHGTHHTSSTVPGQQASSGVHYGGTDATPVPTHSIDPRVDRSSGKHEPLSATDSAYAGSPTTGDSPSSASGEKKGGLLNKLLHRDDPNKLSKDAGTSHHHGTGSGSGSGTTM